MNYKAGLWIDHRKAVIVINTDDGYSEITKIKSNLEKHVRHTSGHARSSDCGPEDQRDKKFAGHLSRYYDQVAALVGGAKSILILGPGQAKIELRKRLESKQFPERKIVIEASDKISDRQIAAKIRRHFPG